jgi:hypothetical protein
MRQLSMALSLLLWVALGSCRSPDRQPDTDSGTSELLDRLAHSRQSWDKLVEAMGQNYSYAEVNCVRSAIAHTRSLVQVENGIANIVGRSEISASDCTVYVNRYNDFTARTLPQLYAECERLIQSLG